MERSQPAFRSKKWCEKRVQRADCVSLCTAVCSSQCYDTMIALVTRCLFLSLRTHESQKYQNARGPWDTTRIYPLFTSVFDFQGNTKNNTSSKILAPPAKGPRRRVHSSSPSPYLQTTLARERLLVISFFSKRSLERFVFREPWNKP